MQKSKNPLFEKKHILPFVLVTALFMFWGIPNNLNDILIKQFMKSFEINRFRAGLVQSAFYLGYFFLAIPAGLIMKKFSYKTGIVIGLLLYSIGTILFLPAAIIGKYELFLFALFVIASGLSFLETGANPFIAGLGSPEQSERRLNFAQSFNPLGAILGVIIGTVFIFSGVEPDAEKIGLMKAEGTYDAFLKSETLRIVKPFIVLGTVVFIWAIVILFVPFPENEVKEADKGKGKISHLLKNSHFIKAVIAQLCYVGAQVGTWSYYIQYIQDYTSGNEKTAGYILTGTLVAFGLGRFVSTYIMKFFNPIKLMAIYSFVNCILILIPK